MKNKRKSKSTLNIIIRESTGEYDDENSDKEKEYNQTSRSQSSFQNNIKTDQLKTSQINTQSFNNKNDIINVPKSKANSNFGQIYNNKTSIKQNELKNHSLIQNESTKEKAETKEIYYKTKKAKTLSKEKLIQINNLHLSKKLNQQKYMKLQKQIIEKNNKGYEQECTFKPKTNKYMRSINEMFENNGDFSLRQKIWIGKVKEK